MEMRFQIALQRLAEFEQAFCDYREATDEKFAVAVAAQTALETQLSVLTDKYNDAVANYNAAVEVINLLSERVTALEANYDPTIIK